jgi:hypothetical protein
LVFVGVLRDTVFNVFDVRCTFDVVAAKPSALWLMKILRMHAVAVITMCTLFYPSCCGATQVTGIPEHFVSC